MTERMDLPEHRAVVGAYLAERPGQVCTPLSVYLDLGSAGVPGLVKGQVGRALWQLGDDLDVPDVQKVSHGHYVHQVAEPVAAPVAPVAPLDAAVVQIGRSIEALCRVWDLEQPALGAAIDRLEQTDGV
jgi:hypothetical protein